MWVWHQTVVCFFCLLTVWRYKLLLVTSDSDLPKNIIDLLSKEDKRFTERYREEEKHWPEECSVFCPSHIKESIYGSIRWPNSSVGYKHLEECPYTSDGREAFASRDCLPLLSTGYVGWGEVNYTECDLLPVIDTVYQLQELKKQTTYGYWLRKSIQKLAQVLTGIPSKLFTRKGNESELAFQVAYFATNDLKFLVDDISITDVLNFFAAVLSDPFANFIQLHNQVPFYVQRIFNNLPSMLKAANVNGSVISTKNFNRPELLSYEVFTVSSQYTATHFIDNKHGMMSISYELCDGCYEYDAASMVLFSTVFSIGHTLSFVEGKSNGTSMPPSLFPAIVFTEVLSPADNHYLPVVQIEFNTLFLGPSQFPMDTSSKTTFSRSSCAWNLAREGFYDLELWNSSSSGEGPCELTSSGYFMVVCKCRGSGYFGIFTVYEKHPYEPPEVNETEISSFAVFLGFSYRQEMWIIGTVLQAVSLLSLVATVVTFAVFKKARRGRTTGLLVNLCLSLIGMDIVIYATPMFSSGQLGCLVCNILRFYFVMASLLWNGAEAYNMYLKLLKVLGHGVAAFVVKAAISAWGLPLFIIGVVILTDREAFKGFYDECYFRCALRENVLVFAFLLPLSAILAHNFVIFILVIRVLRQPRFSQEAENSRANTWGQVGSGVTLLALLGLPWIFSAFGALDVNQDDGHLDRTEAMLHFLFLAGVNLQGVFIFTSQCLRRSDIRRLWLSALTPATLQQTPAQPS